MLSALHGVIASSLLLAAGATDNADIFPVGQYNSNGTLTPSNGRTLTRSGDSSSSAGKANITKTTGKHYFEGRWHEVQTLSSFESQHRIGIVQNSQDINAATAASWTTQVAFAVSGQTFVGATATQTYGTSASAQFITSSHAVRVAVDLDAELIWYSVDGTLWNNNVGADPATGTLGISFSSFSGGAYAPVLILPDTAPRGSLFLFADEQVGTPPAGFSAWGGAGGGAIPASVDMKRIFQASHASTRYTTARLNLIEALISDIGALWGTKIKSLTMLAAPDAILSGLNLVGGQVATLNTSANLPRANDDYTGGARASYAFSATGYYQGNVATDAEGYTQNDQHIGLYSQTSLFDIGADTTNTNGEVGTRKLAIGKTATGLALRGGSTTTVNVAGQTLDGHVVISRNNSANYDLIKNGVVAVNNVQASVTIDTGTTYAMRINAANASSTAWAPGRNQLSCVHWGTALTAAECATVKTAIETYLTAIGALP